jgi:hypothetical protein
VRFAPETADVVSVLCVVRSLVVTKEPAFPPEENILSSLPVHPGEFLAWDKNAPETEELVSVEKTTLSAFANRAPLNPPKKNPLVELQAAAR